MPKLDPERNDAKHVLDFIFQKIVNFKKLNQDFQSVSLAQPVLALAPQLAAAHFSFSGVSTAADEKETDMKSDSKDDYEEKPSRKF